MKNSGLMIGLVLAAGAGWLWMRQTNTGLTAEDLKKLLGGSTGGGSTGGGAGGSTGGGAGTGAGSTVKTLAQQLMDLAGSNANNADAWNYFLARISGRAPVQDPAFGTAFMPQGRPEDGNLPILTAEEFVSKAKAAGASGLDGYRRVGQMRPPVVIDLAAVKL